MKTVKNMSAYDLDFQNQKEINYQVGAMILIFTTINIIN